jgi:hypothetical protein
MTGLALIAAMVALASPTAHGDFNIDCKPLPVGIAGYAYPWENRVEMLPAECRAVGRVVLHRPSAALTYGLPTLLHEAAHVAQWREGVSNFLEPDRWYEHDAECRMLEAFPPVARKLRYRVGRVADAVKLLKQRVLTEHAPYGGPCAPSPSRARVVG